MDCYSHLVRECAAIRGTVLPSRGITIIIITWHGPAAARKSHANLCTVRDLHGGREGERARERERERERE